MIFSRFFSTSEKGVYQENLAFIFGGGGKDQDIWKTLVSNIETTERKDAVEA